MARLDLPIGVLKHPVEPDACSLCPDGGRDRASIFCPAIEAPVCNECCSLMLGGEPYRLLTATAHLARDKTLADLLTACLRCGNLSDDDSSGPWRH